VKPVAWIGIALVLLVIAGAWRMFDKAGKPGWTAIVPVYNLMMWAEIAGRPAWHGLLALIPAFGVVFVFMIAIDVAKSFGRSGASGAGIVLLGFVFLPWLGFGRSTYLGPVYRD